MGVSADPGQLTMLTRLLLATSITYLILTLPSTIYVVAYPYILPFYKGMMGYVNICLNNL